MNKFTISVSIKNELTYVHNDEEEDNDPDDGERVADEVGRCLGSRLAESFITEYFVSHYCLLCIYNY